MSPHCDYCRAEAKQTSTIAVLAHLSMRRRLELEHAARKILAADAPVATGDASASAVPGGALPETPAPLRLTQLEDVVAKCEPEPDEYARRIFSRDLLVRYEQRETVSGDLLWTPIELEDTPSGQPAAHSPVLAALRQRWDEPSERWVNIGTSYLNGQPSLTLPKNEDIAIHIVLLLDPLSNRPFAWALKARGSVDGLQLPDESMQVAPPSADAAAFNLMEMDFDDPYRSWRGCDASRPRPQATRSGRGTSRCCRSSCRRTSATSCR